MALPVVQAATYGQPLTGEIVINIVDDFASGTHSEQAVLDVGGEQLQLVGLDPQAFAPGTAVQVHGRRVGDSIQVGPTDVRAVTHGTALAAEMTATFEKRVAVLLVNFVRPTPSPTPTPTVSPPPTASPAPTDVPTDALPSETPVPSESPAPTETPTSTETPPPTESPSATPSPTPSPTPTPPPEPWSKSFVRGVYFDNAKSVASYYSELSDGRMAVTGDVFGYFTLTAETSSCSYNTWGTLARDAATRSGIDLSAYTNIAYVLPRQQACSWGGIANLPGKHSYINGSNGWSGATWLYVASHELGHNFGMNHAATLSCTRLNTRVAYASNCSTDDYGDPFDIMGYQGQRHVSTWHRWQMGLLGATDVQTISASGIYTIATAQIAGGTPRVMRIPRGTNYWYLEFRQPYGTFDNFSLGASVVSGVLIRSAPGVDRALFSKLVDTTPWTSSYNDAALAVGQSFGDATNDICVVTRAIGPLGAEVQVHIGPDSVAPTAVASLTATADSPGVVALSWPAATDNLPLTGYQVARDGTPIGIAYGTTFTDGGAAQARSHEWSVSGLDCVGNLGGAATASLFVPDTTAPGVAPNFRAVVRDATTVDLTWGAASDNVGVTAYRVSRNGVVLDTTSLTSFVDTSAPEGVELNYQLVAIDAAGNVGKAAKASARDLSAPTWSGALSLTLDAGVVQVSWPAALDNAGVTSYELRRGGVPIATLAATSYTDAAIEQLHDYWYGVFALDAAGNKSAELSGSISVPDLTAPGAVGDLLAVQSGPRLVDLSWTAPSDNVGVDHYLVTMDGADVGTVAATGLAGIAAADGLAHDFAVVAVDAAGNVGPEATTQIVLPDATPPDAPGSLVAIATGATTVALSWTAASDNIGVTGYRLTRDGFVIANLAATASAFTDSNVPSDRTYAYALTALDAAGNASTPASVSVTLVSRDTVAPTAPTGLKATAIGGRRVSLTWLASTDNRAGTIRYKVFRGKRKIAVVTTLGYVDRPSLVGNYRYRVRAVDAAGNASVFTAWVYVRAVR